MIKFCFDTAIQHFLKKSGVDIRDIQILFDIKKYSNNRNYNCHFSQNRLQKLNRQLR